MQPEQLLAQRSTQEMLQALCEGRDDAVPQALVIQAHPDDEVIGLGAHLPRLCNARFLHVTDGAPRDGHDASRHGFAGAHEYALARRQELEAAMALAGVAPDQLLEMSCPDQQASFCMPTLAFRLAQIMCELQPELVITHPYEGGHPDHDATALAVHAARRLLAQRGYPMPQLAEASSYHMGPDGIRPCSFLPSNAQAGNEPPVVVHLNSEQRELKQRMLTCFRTQAETLTYFPIEIECFRVAPVYDFTQPPHPGMLFYEKFPWGITGAQFRELARSACQIMGLNEAF